LTLSASGVEKGEREKTAKVLLRLPAIEREENERGKKPTKKKGKKNQLYTGGIWSKKGRKTRENRGGYLK